MQHRPRIVLALVAAGTTALAGPQPPPAQQKLAHDIYKQLVEIDTTAEHGDTFVAAQAMASRLLAAGFPKADVSVFQPAPHRGNLVARLRGTGKRKPLLLMAHLDVVEAKRADWSTDPFKLVEQGGYFYGRGTGDDKFMASAWVANMVRWKQEHYRPDRDLILVLETDEEAADAAENGIRWLLKNHRDLIDAEFALNEGGGVAVKDGKPAWNSIQTTEKMYQSYQLEATNPGGHSSQPRKDNAIYELAEALVRLEKLELPVELNPTTRGYFEKMARLEAKPELAAAMRSLVSASPDPAAVARLTALPPYNATLRTTCVATRLEGGHADNALPQMARALVNCRILPGHSADEVERAIEAAVADPKIAVTLVGSDVTSEPSPLDKELVGAVEKLTARFWPGIPVVPTMSAGATDGRFLRNAGIPCYGHSGLASDIFDVRAHGKDERVSVSAFYDGQEYLYELVKVLAGGR
ncbi:MAG TPA: M20/M25/M40 family metallo-hydrolase [Kofleriaceae bacterium]|nr:M20/M25/M40 family metallo-hydrolase [Kofleriaceae bacterium]